MNKGLEALKEHIINLKSMGYTRCEEWLDLIVIEKELKALKIIKEKLIDINWLKGCEELADYNDLNEPTLEQEEYDLLKEILNA